MNAFNRFERMPIPVVAAVQGLCFGRGLEFALRADIVFAGESARFGHPEQTLGIATMLGGIYRGAARAGRFRAAEWAFTSEQVPAATMEQFGVVNRVVPDMKLLEEAHSFALKMARGPTRAHAAHKALLRTWAAGGCGYGRPDDARHCDAALRDRGRHRWIDVRHQSRPSWAGKTCCGIQGPLRSKRQFPRPRISPLTARAMDNPSTPIQVLRPGFVPEWHRQRDPHCVRTQTGSDSLWQPERAPCPHWPRSSRASHP